MAKAKASSNAYRHSSLGDRIFDVCNVIFMILLVIVTLYPFLNMFALSFNDANDSVRGDIYIWPREWTLRNFEYVFSESDVFLQRLSPQHGRSSALWSPYSVQRCWPIR